MEYGFGLWMFRLVVVGVPVGLAILIPYAIVTNSKEGQKAKCDEAGGVLVLDQNRQAICIRKDVVLTPSAPPR